MNRFQFLILTSLSGVIALCILLQIVFVRMAQADEARLKQTEDTLQAAQLYENRLVEIAKRIAQVAQTQQDQGLRDLLARQNFQIKSPSTNAAAATPPETAPAPASTH